MNFNDIFLSLFSLFAQPMNHYTGVYMDGKTSYAHEANIELLDDVLWIRYYDQHDDFQEVKWSVKNLKRFKLIGEKRNVMTYGDFPHQTLEVDSEDFTQALKWFYPQLKSQSYDAIIRNKFPIYWVILGIIALILMMLF